MATYPIIAIIAIKILFLANIVLDAISDAKIDITRKRNHTMEALSIGALLICIYLANWYLFDISRSQLVLLLSSFLFLRAALFNIIYNRNADNDDLYVGGSNLYDRCLKILYRIETRRRFPALTFYYFGCLFLGICLGLNDFLWLNLLID